MIWATVAHALMVTVCIFAFRDKAIWLLLSETVVVLSVVLSLWFWYTLSKSIKVSTTCLEMINEQDFSSQLRHVGYLEADRMIDVYNRMITELREQRLLVRDKNQFLDLLIEASPMGIIILDFDMYVTSANPSAIKSLQVSPDELRGHQLSEFDGVLTKALSELNSEEPQLVEIGGINRYRCSLQFFIDHGFRHPFILIEEMTYELLAAERHASEKVIRTLSHEVNNTLSSINSNLSVLLGLENVFPEKLRPDIIRALQLSIERSDNLCRLVSSFADIVKLPAPKLVAVGLNALVQNTMALMHSLFESTRVRYSLELDKISPVVMMDAVQMEQVLINIIKNSLEAIGTDGMVTIITINTPPAVIIRDTGHGIAEKLRNQIFSPFFSTKPDGQGIGLMLVREILLNHHFSFSLETVEEGRTEFKIEF